MKMKKFGAVLDSSASYQNKHMIVSQIIIFSLFSLFSFCRILGFVSMYSFVMDGNGIFDVRDESDKWIRIEVCRGDLLIVVRNQGTYSLCLLFFFVNWICIFHCLFQKYFVVSCSVTYCGVMFVTF